MQEKKDFRVRLRGRLKWKNANDKSNQCVKKKEKRKKKKLVSIKKRKKELIDEKKKKKEEGRKLKKTNSPSTEVVMWCVRLSDVILQYLKGF